MRVILAGDWKKVLSSTACEIQVRCPGCRERLRTKPPVTTEWSVKLNCPHCPLKETFLLEAYKP